MAISTSSFSKTPQAGNDVYDFNEDVFNTNNGIVVLDVLANDLGGSAKQLWSVDDGDGALKDLLTSNVTTGWETTAQGNLMRINAGKVEYKMADGVNINSLAEGEHYTDSFVYAIRLGNGTLSMATVSLTIDGVNDVATFGGTVTGSVTEDDTDQHVASGMLTVHDVDHDQSGFQAIDADDLEGTYGTFTFNELTGAWTYTLDDNKANALTASDQVIESLTVKSIDGTETTIDVTVNGANESGTVPTLGGIALFVPYFDNLDLPYDDEDFVGGEGTLSDVAFLRAIDADGDYQFDALFLDLGGMFMGGTSPFESLAELAGATATLTSGGTTTDIELVWIEDSPLGLALGDDDLLANGSVNFLNDSVEGFDYVTITTTAGDEYAYALFDLLSTK